MMYKEILIVFCSSILLTGCVSEVNEMIGEFDPAHLSREEVLENAESLEAQINLGLGSLKMVKGDADTLYDLRIDYNGKSDKPEVDFSRSGNRASLRVSMEGKQGSGWWKEDNKINLSISPEVDFNARLTTGVGENLIDLSGLKVAGLEVVNGVGNTEIYMDEINGTDCKALNVTNGIGHLEMTGLGNYGFSDFRFNGGIGDSTLDFSGDWKSVGDISIKVGLGSLEVVVPDYLGVKVRSSKSFLSSMQMPGFEQVGNEYVSSNIKEAEKQIVIQVNTGIGDVRFRRN